MSSKIQSVPLSVWDLSPFLLLCLSPASLHTDSHHPAVASWWCTNSDELHYSPCCCSLLVGRLLLHESRLSAWLWVSHQCVAVKYLSFVCVTFDQGPSRPWHPLLPLCTRRLGLFSPSVSTGSWIFQDSGAGAANINSTTLWQVACVLLSCCPCWFVCGGVLEVFVYSCRRVCLHLCGYVG